MLTSVSSLDEDYIDNKHDTDDSNNSQHLLILSMCQVQRVLEIIYLYEILSQPFGTGIPSSFYE